MRGSEMETRTKIHEIHLKYVDTNFRKMKKVKDHKGLTWEDLIFLAIINLEKVK